MYIAADQEKDSSYSNIIMQNDCRGMYGNSFEGRGRGCAHVFAERADIVPLYDSVVVPLGGLIDV